MADEDDPTTTGRCLCGAVSFTLDARPEGYGACHCAMCRRWSGGIELGVMTDVERVRFEGAEHIRTYVSSDWAERGFCGTCGSSLYWKLTAPGDHQGMMSISAGALDSLDGLELTSEVFIDHKPAGHAFAGDRHRMTEADVLKMAGLAPGG